MIAASVAMTQICRRRGWPMICFIIVGDVAEGLTTQSHRPIRNRSAGDIS